MTKKFILYLVIFSATFIKAQFNYGHQMDFGKNRVQYKNFEWQYLDYDRYRIYFYQGGVEIARYASISMTRQLSSIEKRLDYQLNDKINILIYNTQEDFKQSNLGLGSDDQSNIGGMTRIVGDKVSIFFNGSHAELDQQLRAAIAELTLNKILYGGNARDMIRNSTLLYLPSWFANGLVKYLSEGWSTQNDNAMYDALRNNTFGTFNNRSGADADASGHAMWYYIISTYGESVIPNVLYMTKLTRSLDHAFITSLGVTLDNLIYDFTESFQRKVFMYRDTARKSPNISESALRRYRGTKHYYQAKVSPSGNSILYATNELNQIKVFIKNFEDKKTERILKLNPKVEQISDYNYPLLAWHPNGENVAIIFPYKNEIVFQVNSLNEGKAVRKNLQGFEKINSFAYSNDGKKIVMSAVKRGKGQSDIFVMTINTGGLEQLTNDIWDDLNPVFAKKSSQVVFESNRIHDTIKANEDAQYGIRMRRNMDIFMAHYPFNNKALVRLTATPDVNERNPQAYREGYITYLSDKNGIYNRYLAQFDSSIAFVDTSEHYNYFFKSLPISNYDRNVLEQDINSSGSHMAQRFLFKGKDMLTVSEVPKLNEIQMREPANTWYRGYVSPAIIDPSDFKEPKINEAIVTPKSTDGSKGIDFDNYQFNGENGKAAEANKKALSRRDSVKLSSGNQFKFPLQKNYYPSFYTDYVVTQLDNSYLANNYQVFSAPGNPIYLNPGFNFLSKIAISDLFEDQRIFGGYRYRLNFSSDNELMLGWEQRKGILDYQMIYDRQLYSDVNTITDNGFAYNAKVITSSFKYSVKYPFSPVSSIRGSILYRNDKKIALSYGDLTLPKKNDYNNQAGLRVEYVYDNTRKVMLNILNGTRIKVWSEYWQSSDKGAFNLFTSGFDVRHYTKVHRQITWCNRFAGGNSMGSKKLIFYLGGVDNWVNPSFNSNVSVSNPSQYGFQTLATNMRGYIQNTRNGNNFLVYNSELRIPVVRYILNYPLKSDFMNNLQVIGFTDIGMAWHGANPLSVENTQNSKEFIQVDPATGVGSTSIKVSVIDYKNPLIGGIGFGFRSRLLGYFVRLDFGWGVDNWVVSKKPITNISFATDF